MCVLCSAAGKKGSPVSAHAPGFQAAFGPVAAGEASSESVGPTRIATVDGLLSGAKWSSPTITYSFPTAAGQYGYTGEAQNNFAAVNATQQSAIVAALGMFSSVSNLSFTAAAAGAGTLRFAQSDLPGTAWAYYPTADEQGGDVWFNQSKGWYAAPQVGNYAFHTILHELGHAVGLKHAHEASGAFKALTGAANSMEYTVMTYASYAGASVRTGYVNETSSYAQSLMLYDIAAIQKLYGANFATNAGDTVYKWSASTGAMQINGVSQGTPAGNHVFMTVWDGGGTDTYDLSDYGSNLTINLAPGAWSTFAQGQLADLNGRGTKLAAGNVANALLFEKDARSLIENVIGGSGNDKIVGNVTNNRLAGGQGNDSLDGGICDDTLVGGAGAETLNGGTGYDWVSYDDATLGIILDVMKGGTGGDATGDRIKAVEGISGSAYADTIIGGTSAETLRGQDGADRLDGGAGNDTVEGGAGDDTILGGAGADKLTGGAGADTFRIEKATDTAKTALTRDVILDFVQGTDRIDLSQIDANTRVAGDQAFTLNETALSRITAPAQLVFRYESVGGTEHTIVAANNDTSVAANFEFALLGHYELKATDFIL